MEENMTDKQMEILLTLVADKFSACKTMEDVEAAVKEVREMTKKKSLPIKAGRVMDRAGGLAAACPIQDYYTVGRKKCQSRLRRPGKK